MFSSSFRIPAGVAVFIQGRVWPLPFPGPLHFPPPRLGPGDDEQDYRDRDKYGPVDDDLGC